MVDVDLGMLVQQPLRVEDSETTTILTQQARTMDDIVAGTVRGKLVLVDRT